MRIYEDLDNSSEPTGMVNFDNSDGTIALFSKPKGSIFPRVINNQRIQVFDNEGEALTGQMQPNEILNSSGIAYGATAADVRKALNAFFFQIETVLPPNVVTAEEVTVTTTNNTRTVLYEIELEEKQSVNVFIRGIAKRIGQSNGYSFIVIGGAVRENDGAVRLGGNSPRILAVENFPSNPRVRHSVNGNFYRIEVDSRSNQDINWLAKVEATFIAT